MSLKLYDEAMTEFIKEVFPNTVFAYQEKAFETRATKRDMPPKGEVEVMLPLVTLNRLTTEYAFEFAGNNNRSLSGYQGLRNRYIKTIPINIVYQIDIWSNKREETDDIFRELSFYLRDNEIEIDFDKDGKKDPLKISFVLHLLDNEDNTDIESFTDKGRIYRHSITVELREAVLIMTSDMHLVKDIPVRLVKLED